MFPLALIAQLATAVPSLLKYFNAGEVPTAIATGVASVATAIGGGATPEEAVSNILGSQEKQQQFKLAVLDKQLEWDKALLSDLSNARQRDTAIVQATGVGNKRANILAGTALLLVMLCLFVTVWDVTSDDFAKATITLILGRALGWVEQIFSFEFGTTRNSHTKDDTINKLSGTGG